MHLLQIVYMVLYLSLYKALNLQEKNIFGKFWCRLTNVAYWGSNSGRFAFSSMKSKYFNMKHGLFNLQLELESVKGSY